MACGGLGAAAPILAFSLEDAPQLAAGFFTVLFDHAGNALEASEAGSSKRLKPSLAQFSGRDAHSHRMTVKHTMFQPLFRRKDDLNLSKHPHASQLRVVKIVFETMATA